MLRAIHFPGRTAARTAKVASPRLRKTFFLNIILLILFSWTVVQIFIASMFDKTYDAGSVCAF